MVRLAPSYPVVERTRMPDVGRQMSAACVRFLESLDVDQKARVAFTANHWERLLWHYAPFESDGLRIKEMTEEQEGLARNLIATGMSDSGTDKTMAIMALEADLGELERSANTVEFDRDPELYFFRIFGDPAGTEPWSWSVNGHHVYLNFVIVDGQYITPTPSFLGSNPAEVPSGPNQGLRILGASEDVARELLGSLDKGQRFKAIVSDLAPLDIVTGNSPKIVDGPGSVLPPEGLFARDMNRSQQEILKRMIQEYVGRLRPELAAQILARSEDGGFERLQLAWAGGIERGQGYYFRIHRLNPGSLLIEHDNVQNGANHIHSVIREADRDFGYDLLRTHYEQHHGF